jgi:hypothetical protein
VWTFEISLIAVPSLVVAGGSQCLWSKEDQSCSEAPPPSDMVFTVVVSLLTTIMTIPFVVILSATLDIYASRWPGEKGEEDRITAAMTEEEGDKQHSRTVEYDTVEKQYFGEFFSRGFAKDKTTRSSLAKETVRFVYNGESCCFRKNMPEAVQ